MNALESDLIPNLIDFMQGALDFHEAPVLGVGYCYLVDLNNAVCAKPGPSLTLSLRILQEADLAGSEDILSAYLAEALQYRPKLMLS